MRVYSLLALTMFMAFAPVHALDDDNYDPDNKEYWCEKHRYLYEQLSARESSGIELTGQQSSFINKYFFRCIQ